MPRTWLANSSESRSGTALPASVSDETLMRARLERAEPVRPLVERGEECRQGLLLLRRQARVGRHDARADLERAGDRVARQARTDMRQLRTRPVVPVVPELVAGEA